MFTVLLVAYRDDPVLRKTLLSLGYRPEIRGTLESALRALRRRRVEFVLMPAAASGVDAVELVLNVRDVEKDIPILVVERAGGELTFEIELVAVA